MEETKKVLIITYYWPPSGGGGVQRWLKFAKYLPDLNWEPFIYTPLNPSFSLVDEGLEREIGQKVHVVKRKIWEPYGISGINGNTGINEKNSSLKNRLAKWVRANLLLPDPRVFWVRGSIKFLRRFLVEENIHLIITTGPPHSMHLIGAGLKKDSENLKWIADFRDPMVQFNFYQKLNPTNWGLNRLKRIEANILENSDAVLSTSSSTKDYLENFDCSKYTAITNGWDEEDFKNYTDKSGENEKYILLHPGSIKSDRYPSHLFTILDSALKEGLINPSRFELRLVGNIDVSVIQKLQNFIHLNKVVSIIDYVNHEDLINIHYAEASGLLLLINNSQSSKANIPGKLFEYFAIQKPILAFGRAEDDAIEILEESGIRTFEYHTQVNYKDLFIAMNFTPNIDFQKYNRKSLTADLTVILDNLMKEIS